MLKVKFILLLGFCFTFLNSCRRTTVQCLIIPPIITYPAIFFDYHEHVAYMHQVMTHIPFDNATILINNAGMNNMKDVEESKYDFDFDEDMNMELPTDTVPHKERLLDVIHLDDDMDETQSIIWVQCRRIKWSCPVELYLVGECQCTWGPTGGLEEDLQALDMEGNILGRTWRSGPSTMTHTRCTLCMATPRRER